MSEYFVLSLDGGGVRGLITSILLTRLEESHPGFLQRVDLFAGTSTGGIIALALAHGIHPKELVRLYSHDSGTIFSTSIWRKIWTLNGFARAKYKQDALHKELSRMIGPNTRLRDLPHRVLISSFDLDDKAKKRRARSWKAKFFHNFPGPDSDGEETAVNVALRTSAAPTYFPAYQGYVDGGVVANNPSVAALVQAMDPATGRQKLSDIRMLSISTGLNPTYLPGKTHRWGILQWARTMTPMIIDGSMEIADFQCSRLLSTHQYCRVNPELQTGFPLDDTRNLKSLARVAETFNLSSAQKWLSDVIGR